MVEHETRMFGSDFGLFRLNASLNNQFKGKDRVGIGPTRTPSFFGILAWDSVMQVALTLPILTILRLSRLLRSSARIHDSQTAATPAKKRPATIAPRATTANG